MKSLAFCAALVAVFALCLPAWSVPPIAKWSQPVDTTNALFGEESQAVVTPPSDVRSADDWKCTDGTPITAIKWWGDYHRYLDTQSGPVAAPSVLPIAFILRQYNNKVADPTDPASFSMPDGAPIQEVVIPFAKCNQTFFQTVSSGTFGQIHIFSYAVTLDTPWTQTKDSIYWLSVQAQYDVDPLVPGPPPGSYLHWEWLSTPTADFLGTALISYDAGATWTNPFARRSSTSPLNSIRSI
jgi:hypothetical protein